jgi:hypothetical protein
MTTSGIGSTHIMYYQLLSLERIPGLKMEEQTKLVTLHKSKKKDHWGEELCQGKVTSIIYFKK